MALIQYVPHTFQPHNRELIRRINIILGEYKALGFNLTLRQLFYQFVSRNWMKNTQKNYDKLGVLLSKARRAGLVDWEAIVDRTRYLRTFASWDEPADIVRSAANEYSVDMWKAQQYRPEVWVEKDALVGIVENVCNKYRVPFFSCRGFISDSEMWLSSTRMLTYVEQNQIPIIIHLADHDPSGLDMTRDIREKFEMFGVPDLSVRRIGLNIKQVEKYDPPPNVAKKADSRWKEYFDRYGENCWELDSLKPNIISKIIDKEIVRLIDQRLWKRDLKKEKEGKWLLSEVADQWDEVVKDLIN